MTAQQLFHSKGYDALSVVDITKALGINPPSFYAVFGSKAGLYARILDRYAQTGAVPLQHLLRADRPLAESLADVLKQAARAYAANPVASGCLVLEGTRANDPEARAAACVFHVAAQDLIRRFIAARYPQEADTLTDSAQACRRARAMDRAWIASWPRHVWRVRHSRIRFLRDSSSSGTRGPANPRAFTPLLRALRESHLTQLDVYKTRPLG